MKTIFSKLFFPKRSCGKQRIASRGFLPRKTKRFRTDEDGATAVEFAMIAAPFFALVYGVMQISFLYLAQETLETGVYAAARMVRTGQAQSSGMDEAAMRTLICSNVTMISDCQSKLVLDMRAFGDFGSVALPPALDASGEIDAGTSFNPGTGGEVVILRAFYAYSMPVPDTVTGMANMSGGRRLIAASTSFRNEPF